MLFNTLKAIDKICPDLQFVTWATGGKWYGFEHSKTLSLHPPMKETDPRVPPPIGDHIFYYGQHDAISAFAKGKRWTFADIRPDAIVSNAFAGLSEILTQIIRSVLCRITIP